MTRLLVQKSGSATFNLAVSTLLAGAAAFATFAMPQSLFEAIIGATGVQNFVSAAEPPLGSTARLAAMAGMAAAGFALAWLVLRAFDGSAQDIGADVEWNTLPRIRRADAHPDAPARRPLLAEQELGEPQDYPSPLQTKPFQARSEPIALSETADPVAPLVEPAAVAVEEPSPPVEPDDFAEPLDLLAEQRLFEPEEAAGQRLEEVEDGAPAESAVSETPVWPLNPVEPEVTKDALIARLALPEDRGGSISSLMQRLDTGLAKIEWPLAGSAGGTPSRPQDEVTEELRSALDDLQRIAGGRA